MDEKLVEAVGQAIADAMGYPPADDITCMICARAALAAIHASETHWVAPRVATEKMICAALEADPGCDTQDDEPWLKAEYAAMRDTYLSEREKRKFLPK